MVKRVFALLVGIDRYDSSTRIPELSGCVNDVQALQFYLEGRLRPTDDQLHLKVLTNEQATRQAIIDGFLDHLGQAGKDDIALFFYAGHGSLENAPEEFWHIEPSRQNQTLVCYDSRCKDVWDLADKELSMLIAEVAKNDPHITIILDCCYSGSGTRGDLLSSKSAMLSRRAPMDQRPRPFDSFIHSLKDLQTLYSERNDWHLPKTRHVLLAACRDIEDAKEYPVEGKIRGAFSYFLLDTLQHGNDQLTYIDVFKQVSARLRSRIVNQTPQLSAAKNSDLELSFWGGAITPRPDFFTIRYAPIHGGWIADGGKIHGIDQPTVSEPTILTVFPWEDNTVTDDKAHNKALGTARVTAVMPSFSKVELIGLEASFSDIFKAVINTLPLRTMGVQIIGDGKGVALLERAIRPSVFVHLEDRIENTRFQVLVTDNHYQIKRPTDTRLLVSPITDAFRTVQRLEHIARWTATLELQSSPNSRITNNAVTMELITQGVPVQSDQVVLWYSPEGKPPKFQLKLRNTSTERLYCSILDFSETFSINALFLESDGIWLEAGEEAYAFDQSMYAFVPQELWQQGTTELKDILKLIVSTTAFDARLLEQTRLDAPRTRSLRSSPPEGMLNRLMKRVQTRDLEDNYETEIVGNWSTSQLLITTIRPQNFVTLHATSSQQELSASTTIYSPRDFSAQVRLTTVNQAVHEVANQVLPPLLQDNSIPLYFTSSAVGPGLSVLELNQVHNQGVVTPNNPLRIIVDIPLNFSEYVLPVAYNGEFYLPLGRGLVRDNRLEITIDYLPPPLLRGAQRSLGGAIYIFFHALSDPVLIQQPDPTFDYPVLSAVSIIEGKTSYLTAPEEIQAEVEQAQWIALYVHGMTSDSQNMVPSIESAMADLNGQTRPLKDFYDLVLAFDYKSSDASLIGHAQALKQSLQTIGLDADHGKTLHIIAHSTGGLVSRWFIEREGGHEIVQHLLLIGTPNAGSSWPKVQAGLILMATLVLNGFLKVALPLRVLDILLRRIAEIDITLDDIEPGSDFLKKLESSLDPGVPYTMVAGTTPLGSEDALGLISKQVLMQLVSLTGLPFHNEPNDLAISVKSMTAIPAGRTAIRVMSEVSCNALTYFSNPAGLETLGKAVSQIFKGLHKDRKQKIEETIQRKEHERILDQEFSRKTKVAFETTTKLENIIKAFYENQTLQTPFLQTLDIVKSTAEENSRAERLSDAIEITKAIARGNKKSKAVEEVFQKILETIQEFKTEKYRAELLNDAIEVIKEMAAQQIIENAIVQKILLEILTIAESLEDEQYQVDLLTSTIEVIQNILDSDE